MTKWEIRAGFTEGETCKQRPDRADGGSQRILGKTFPGRGKSKDKLSKGRACLVHGRKCDWNRGSEGSVPGAGIRGAGAWGRTCGPCGPCGDLAFVVSEVGAMEGSEQGRHSLTWIFDGFLWL